MLVVFDSSAYLPMKSDRSRANAVATSLLLRSLVLVDDNTTSVHRVANFIALTLAVDPALSSFEAYFVLVSLSEYDHWRGVSNGDINVALSFRQTPFATKSLLTNTSLLQASGFVPEPPSDLYLDLVGTGNVTLVLVVTQASDSPSINSSIEVVRNIRLVGDDGLILDPLIHSANVGDIVEVSIMFSLNFTSENIDVIEAYSSCFDPNQPPPSYSYNPLAPYDDADNNSYWSWYRETYFSLECVSN
jgi:hypothetical protein